MIRNFKKFIPNLASSVYVDEQATVIGDVVIGKDSSIWPQTVLRGDINPIRIGERTNIQDGSVVHVTHSSKYSEGFQCHIGSDVTIGHGCIIHACSIEDMCLIGMGSVILDGVKIPPRVIIGAKSLVASGRTLESGYLYLGSPCKQKRPLNESELEFLKYSAGHYVKTKNDYLNES